MGTNCWYWLITSTPSIEITPRWFSSLTPSWIRVTTSTPSRILKLSSRIYASSVQKIVRMNRSIGHSFSLTVCPFTSMKLIWRKLLMNIRKFQQSLRNSNSIWNSIMFWNQLYAFIILLPIYYKQEHPSTSIISRMLRRSASSWRCSNRSTPSRMWSNWYPSGNISAFKNMCILASFWKNSNLNPSTTN